MMRPNISLAVLLWLAAGSAARADLIVNIGGTVSGFSPGTPEGTRLPGDPAVPVGVLNQLTLPAGEYLITNAAGLSGANPDYTGWRFNSGDNWVWNFVIANAATDKVLLFGFAGTENGIGVWNTQAEVAAQPSVRNFSTTLVLAATTTVNFGVRDYFLPDNAGGVALQIHVSATPEPSGLQLMGIGAGGLFVRWGVRRRATRCGRRSAGPT